MKWLRIIHSTNPKTGGVIESVIQSSLALQSFGHQVEIVCLDAPNAEWLHQYSLKIYALGSGILNYGYCPAFKQWLKIHYSSYEVFIIEGLWQYHSMISCKILTQNHCLYYVYPHGMLDPWFQKFRLKHYKKQFYWYFYEYQVLHQAKAVLFTTKLEQELAINSFKPYACDSRVIPIGTAGCMIQRETAIMQFYSHYPQLIFQPFILYLARIHPKKGLDLLLSSLASLKSKGYTPHLVIAGPDSIGWQAELIKLTQQLAIESQISWIGMLTAELKWGAYYAAQAFILPSHSENFALTVAESLSCSLPVLISNKVQIYPEIQHYQAGLIAENSQFGCEQLLQQWQHLTEHDYMQMRIQARHCFMDCFNITQNTQQLITFISE